MATLTSKDRNDLSDSDFAYVDSEGTGHLPIEDEAHVKAALSRFNQTSFDSDASKKATAKKILAKAKSYGIDVSDDSAVAQAARDAKPEGEERDAPTYEDDSVMWALSQAKQAIAHAKTQQLADPDNGSDPDDAAVMAQIEAADAAIEKAISAQSVDGHPDKSEKKAAKLPATAKRSFWSLTERPTPAVATIEVRMDAEGIDENVCNFRGYASTTGTGYPVNDWLGEYRETIMPGAFAKTLREQGDVPLLFDHAGVPLASTGSKTSRLSEDGHGLLNEANLDRSDGQTNTICVQLRRGVLNKMSFSFRSIRDDWNKAYDERSVSELALFDTSVVTYPANPATSAELRNAFREALGREGLGVMYSARAALFNYVQRRCLDEAAEPVLEQAVRALAGADEVVCRRTSGPLARARTFLVAGLMEEVRAGKVLSAKNQQLVNDAVDALTNAAKHHAQTASHLQAASDSLSQLPNGTEDNNGAPTGDNPISPQDGAGPRSMPPSVLKAQRQLDALKRLAA